MKLVINSAVVAGLDYYKHFSCLKGCAQDASDLKRRLSVHADNDPNMEVNSLLAKDKDCIVRKADLVSALHRMFRGNNTLTVFYFSGLCIKESGEVYLLASDDSEVSEDLSLTNILKMAEKSPAHNNVIIIDAVLANVEAVASSAERERGLSEGLSLLLAVDEKMSARRETSQGIFSHIMLEALDGAAANILGEVTPSGVYAHIDQSLTDTEQRPVFMAKVSEFVSLRTAEPTIDRVQLRRISDFFPDPEFHYPLDPSYEPTSDVAIPANTEKFGILQKFNRTNLVVPVGAEHMYFAAMESKACRLTELGKHYRYLVCKGWV